MIKTIITALTLTVAATASYAGNWDNQEYRDNRTVAKEAQAEGFTGQGTSVKLTGNHTHANQGFTEYFLKQVAPDVQIYNFTKYNKFTQNVVATVYQNGNPYGDKVVFAAETPQYYNANQRTVLVGGHWTKDIDVKGAGFVEKIQIISGATALISDKFNVKPRKAIDIILTTKHVESNSLNLRGALSAQGNLN